MFNKNINFSFWNWADSSVGAKVTLIVLTVTATCFGSSESFGQDHNKFSDIWKVEVGPTFALPQWSFRLFNSAGVGIDVGVSRKLSKVPNLYYGGRVYYGHFFAQKNSDLVFDVSDKPFHMIGIVGDAHYILKDRYVGGVNLGIGIPTIQYDAIGLARSVYIGYRLPVQAHFLTPAVFMNRTTYATWNVGLRISYVL